MAADSLNQAQKEAVEYVNGPLLLVAGAGTGKTTVITEKIAYLVNDKGVKPEQILALTFTDKAAAEMEDRVDARLEGGYMDLSISTFHMFCQRLLERHGIDIGLSNHFKLMTGTEAWLLVRKHLYDFNLDYYRPLGNPSKHIHEFLKHFSKCKDELISPAEYVAYAESETLNTDKTPAEEQKRLTEIANAYHTYNQLLLDNNALDFGDLIYYAVKLLQERPLILQKLQQRFKYILVDEFQDVNWAQYELVRLLTGETNQLTVVGDDDQSIYAFRGASVSNILRFKDDFPKAKEIVLTENYRSGQKILDTAYESIQGNNPDRLEVKLQINKQLTAGNKKQLTGIVAHEHFGTLDEEVDFVVEQIAKIKRENESAVWDDFAILVRANSHADPFIQGLEQRGIPYEFLASSGLFLQSIVIDCVNFFKIITNYHESTAVYRLLRLSFLKLSENDLQKFTVNAKKKSIPYYDALKCGAEFHLSPEGMAVCDRILAFIHEGMKLSRDQKPTAVLYQFLEGSGYLAYLTHEEQLGNREVIRQIYHLQQWFQMLRQYEQTVPGAHVAGLMEEFEQMVSAGDDGAMQMPTDTPDSVNILTIHSAKGLEFKYVFLVDLVEERFPTRARSDAIEIPLPLIKEQLPQGDSHIQEERRLFYVGMTRAKERLYFTSADNYGGVRKKKLSRFLVELGFQTKENGVETETKLKNYRIGELENKPGKFIYELPAKFSFSQVKAYQTCPYQYKLAHILKIPTRGSHSFSFGQSIHATMQKFYERVQELNAVQQGSLFGTVELPSVQSNVKVPPFEELLKMYEESWIADWYQSQRQREDYFAKGKEILRLFYTSHEGSWTIPLALESWFKIKVGDYLLHGRIDRIDKLPDGTLEIIDYKTGASKEKVVGEEKDQLLIYQIAAQSLPEYSSMGKTTKLTFYYVNDNVTTSFIGDDEELDALKEKLKATIDAIHSGDFSATPSSFVCKYCDFKDICEYRVI